MSTGDMSSLRHQDGRVVGSIEVDDLRLGPPAVDLVGIPNGQPFDPVTGEDVPPNDWYTVGTAIATSDAGPVEISLEVTRPEYAVRLQHIGGTVVSITEFAFTSTPGAAPQITPATDIEG